MSVTRMICLAVLLALCGAVAGCAAAQAPPATASIVDSGVTSATAALPSTSAATGPTPTSAATRPTSTTALIAGTTTTEPSGPGGSPTDAGADTTSSTASYDARAEVLKVVDGDTIQVRILGGDFPGTASGATEEVRVIGIDAPEKGEAFSAAATAALKRLCAGKEVGLDADQDARDQYGRLLAYVFLKDGTFVDAEMLRLGLATLYIVPPNERFVDELEQAQSAADDARVGIWAASRPSPLKIVTVNYNPPGDDTQDLNAEYIAFEVLTAGNLKGYAVEDESGKHFDFPGRVYQKGQTITLHSGRGTNTGADLYWGVTTSAIWNNDGDTVKVLDPQGHIVASYTY